jgi:hypothetical protein
MTPLNTLPIEDFLNKARVAIKSNQRSIILDLKETTDLANSLSIVMTRLSGELDKVIQNTGTLGPTEVKMDGGGF